MSKTSIKIPSDLTTFSHKGLETNYPNFMLMTTEEIHENLLKINYDGGFPGMNEKKSWKYVGNFYKLVRTFMKNKKDQNSFVKWLEEGDINEEDAFSCYNALSMKYGFI
jgi:hypothetical protein